MSKYIYVMLFAAFTAFVSADDLTTKSGVVYQKYSIEGTSTAGLVIFHELGGATVPYTELPDDLRAKYKADEEKAAIALKEQAEQRKKLEEQRQAEANRQAELREQWEKKKAEEERLKAKQEAEKEKQRKADAEKGIFTIPNYINDAFGINFGRSYLSDIRRFENSSAFKSISGLIKAGSFPKYGFDPQNSSDVFFLTVDGKQKRLGNYNIYVIGKDRIAYMVMVNIPSQYANDVLSVLKKQYVDFYFPEKTTRYRAKTIKLISEKNQDRVISLSIAPSGELTVSYYCKDIEEKYKEKDVVSVGR